MSAAKLTSILAANTASSSTKGPDEEIKLRGPFLHVTAPDHRQPRTVKRLVSAWYRDRARARIAEHFSAISARFGCRPPASFYGQCRAAGEAGAAVGGSRSIPISFEPPRGASIT